MASRYACSHLFQRHLIDKIETVLDEDKQMKHSEIADYMDNLITALNEQAL
jgi:nucleosome binding factor SPN SPT16 subunit